MEIKFVAPKRQFGGKGALKVERFSLLMACGMLILVTLLIVLTATDIFTTPVWCDLCILSGIFLINLSPCSFASHLSANRIHLNSFSLFDF